MIEPKELRIDSIVTDRHRRILRVAEIFEDRVRCRVLNCEVPDRVPIAPWFLHEIEPIPLTPELLEKCGFFKKKDSGHDTVVYVYGDLSFPASLHFPPDSSTPVVFGYMGIAIEHIKYLHQLQNAHYALTDTDLVVNL